jgi:hypothetical protein
VDIVYNIFWSYKAILETLKRIANTGFEIHPVIDWIEDHNYLECFEIKKQIIMPYFGS